MNYTTFFLLIGVLGLLYLYLGKLCSSHIKTLNDFFLGGRSITFLALSITILATQLGGGTLIGITETTYQMGWLGMLYSVGIFSGLLLLSIGVGAKIRAKEVSTLAELFEVSYQSKTQRKIASCASIFSLFLILVGQSVACQRFFTTVGFTNDWLFLCFWAVIILYTVMGGLKAVIATDIVQASFIVIVFLILGAYLIPHVDSSLLTGHRNPHTEEVSFTQLIDWWILPMLFMTIGQDMGQRFSAASSPRAVSKATLIAALIYGCISLVPALIGLVAHDFGISASANESVLIKVIMFLTNPYMAAFAACAILMAILSTADSLICAISSNLTLDFGRDLKINHAKLLTFMIGFSAIVLSFYFTEILSLTILGYRTAIYMLFWPILIAVLVTNPPRQLPYINFVVGLILSVGEAIHLWSPLTALLGFVFLGLGQLSYFKCKKISFV